MPRDYMKRTAKPGLPAGWQAGLGQGLERINIVEPST